MKSIEISEYVKKKVEICFPNIFLENLVNQGSSEILVKCYRRERRSPVDVRPPQKRVQCANKPKWTANKYSSTRGLLSRDSERERERGETECARMPGHDPADARVNGRFSALKGFLRG